MSESVSCPFGLERYNAVPRTTRRASYFLTISMLSAALLSGIGSVDVAAAQVHVGYDIISSRHDYGNIIQEEIVGITCDAEYYFISWTDDDVMICLANAECTLRTNRQRMALRSLGAVVIGKTHTVEFAFGASA